MGVDLHISRVLFGSSPESLQAINTRLMIVLHSCFCQAVVDGSVSSFSSSFLRAGSLQAAMQRWARRMSAVMAARSATTTFLCLLGDEVIEFLVLLRLPQEELQSSDAHGIERVNQSIQHLHETAWTHRWRLLIITPCTDLPIQIGIDGIEESGVDIAATPCPSSFGISLRCNFSSALHTCTYNKLLRKLFSHLLN